MKFRIIADSKDITLFLFYALFLLYVVCILVINIPAIISGGEFYGLNPFPAFSGDYIAMTLVIYVFAIGFSLFSVQSYFFEFERGYGIGITNGASGGYSDWAREKDIKQDKNVVKIMANAKHADAAGVPLICNGRELWVDNGEYHTLVIGATGSGKTQDVIFPTIKVLAKHGESIICTDPKGELYEETAGLLRAKGYDILVLNFRNPQKGGAWNPLSMPYGLYKNGNKDKAIELLDDLAANILYDENNQNQDPFWEKTAADYFAGIALALFEDAPENQININSINMTATVGDDKIGGSTYIKEYFNMKDPNSAAYVNASATITAPSDTKGSIVSVFKEKVKLFASRENLSEMLSHTDIDLSSIGKKPTAVYIIIQDEKKTYHSLATIFLKQVYETLIDVAQENGGHLPVRTNFLLDEFANMPPLKDVTTMITAARSRHIRFTMIIQNYAQLNKVYGKDDAETIKGNCGNIIYLISTELQALEEISKLCGEKKSKQSSKTASTPLVTVNDLQRMKQFDHILLRMRKSPYKTSFVPNFKIDWGETKEEISYPNREKAPVSIFDIREFVKAKRAEKMEEARKNLESPMGGPLGGSSGGLFDFDNRAPRGEGGLFDRRPSSSLFGDYPPPPSFGGPKKYDEPSIDVNDLVKKIDAKLEELEKEEAAENKAKEEAKKQNDKKENKEDSFNFFESIDKDENIKEAKTEPFKETKSNNNTYGLSTKDIEEKVNKKLSSKNDNFDILAPIEKEHHEEPKKSSISKYGDEIENLDDDDLLDYIDKKVSIEKTTEPKTELKLDEKVEDDEKFFDDFFDD